MSESSSSKTSHSHSSTTSSSSPITSPPSSTFTNPFSNPSQSSFSSSSNSGQSPDALQSSASLYLYTFLATLVLLLGVSAAIVVRSLLLRRRHRRMIEEAIRNGTWIPPSNSRLRIDPSKKPHLFEAYLTSMLADGKLKSTASDEQEWDGIMPFSAMYGSTQPGTQTPPSTPAESTTDVSHSLTTQLRSRWRRAFQSNNSAPASPLVMSSVTTSTLSNNTSPLASVRVAVLIAMPSRMPLSSVIQQNHIQHLEEDDLPHLEFGVADIPVQQHPSEVQVEQNEPKKRSIGSSMEL